MRPAWFRVVRPLFLSLAILSCATEQALGPTITSANHGAALGEAPSPGRIVISQVYGGGGNAGATFNKDFIELFNAGGT
ncbi:MAG TPA: hypothetical protein VM166_10215, partial [Gemmatimonadaceae bacterium]|nr:hypothetical protein [Gemmatimonadaceae bacterium]